MKTNDEALLKIKYNVLRTVSRLAFEGRLEEERDNIPFKLIPGPKAQFRCCVYKEREIIRQRVRLAEGKAPGAEDDGNVIQVISSACEDCPISSYTVTENCQNCLGKACVNACKFGAIEREETAPILILPNVKSVEDVHRHVLTMQSHI